MNEHHRASAMEKGEAGFADRDDPPSSPIGSPTANTSTSTQSDSTLLNPSFHNLRFPTTWPTFPSITIPRIKIPHRQKDVVPIRTRRINDHAKGYPNLAAFLDSDEGFAVYRRFGYLQSRILLRKQEELRVLEENLQTTERKILFEDSDALCYRELFGTHATKHGEILDNIEKTFCSYAQILNAAQQMMSFKRPSHSEHRSVWQFLENRNQIGKEEATWIQNKEDIITLRSGRDHAWLDEIVERLLKLCHCKLVDMIFCSKETRKKTEIDGPNMLGMPPTDEDKFELYYTPSRIAKIANSILILLVLVLLVLPIYLLYHMVHDVGSHEAYLVCIGLLLVFTLAFSSTLSLFTKAKRHEILAAAAAYCAVLVVFLGNVAPPDASSNGIGTF